MDKYKKIVDHYEDCLDKHGDTHKGVDWPNLEDVQTRYKVMLDIAKFDMHPNTTPSVLDFGCGAGHMLSYMREQGMSNWKYVGLDLSEKFVALCKQKFPEQEFIQLDVLKEPYQGDVCDYIVMNGVFTEKREMSFEEMLSYFEEMLVKVFPLCKRGIAFNTMSKAVDWERDDLFHLPMDVLMKFASKNLSRNVIMRNDYGLYEYTTYIYHSK
jgi:SAM-dependent methyltransferase